MSPSRIRRHRACRTRNVASALLSAASDALASCEPLESRRLFASISGAIYNDLNDNGAKDSGENGLQSWTVFIDADNDLVLDTGEQQTATDASGAYTLASVPTGTSHYVRAVQQAGWRQSYPQTSHLISVSDAGTVVTGIDFGETQKGRVKGTVFNDANYNGTKDWGERYLPGTRATAYVDVNGNSALDTGEPSATVNALTAYEIKNVDTGSAQTIRMSKAGWATSAPAAGSQTVTLSSGQVATIADFGMARALGAPISLQGARDSVDPTKANLTWIDSSSHETGFHVEQSTDGGSFLQVAELGVNVESHTVTGLSTTSNYRYRVASYDANGNSYYSNIVNIDLAAPTGVQTLSNLTDVIVSWNAVPNAVSYDVYQTATQNAPLGSPVATGVTTNSITFSATVNGPVAYYTIIAVGTGGAAGGGASGGSNAGQAVLPTGAGVDIAIASFALPGKALATWNPNDAHPNPDPDPSDPEPNAPYSDNYIEGSVGVSKWNPAAARNQGKTFVGATGQLDWSAHITGDGGPGLWSGSMAFGYANENADSTVTPPVGIGNTQVGSVTIGNRPGEDPRPPFGISNTNGNINPITVDNPPTGIGVNEIEIWTDASAYASTPPEGAGDNQASISGFFMGFYTVTYSFTVPAAPAPAAPTAPLTNAATLRALAEARRSRPRSAGDVLLGKVTPNTNAFA